ncbi:MAG TPA: ATPase, partial [Candidatus Limnocylindria bacterium]|nr:ATPase [Candidatus Limnocylindria bacterium]
DDLAAAAAWRNAAGAAESRHVGTDALRLRRAAADAAVRAGDRAGAAADLARNAELINRGPGLLATEPAAEDVAALLGEGWLLAGDDLAAQARLMTAEAFARDVADQATLDLVERAITLARDVDDPLTESAALDRLTAIELAGGQVRAGLASALRRVELVARLEVVPTVGLELLDSYSMAADCAIAAGDLGLARRLAERLRVLPFHLEEGHLATSRLLVVTVMTGDWTESVGLAEQYREGWERAGRPRAGNLSRGAYAAATVHGLRGDERSRSGWLEVVDAIRTPGRPLNAHHSSEFFDAMLLLHQGHPDRAAAVMATPPEELNQWYSGLWRPWYAALWAEAAVLSGREDAADRLDRARRMSADNPIAVAIIDRAAALSVTGDDREGLIVAAAALEAAECRYQWARTLVVLGGSDRERGEHLLSMMGAAPMVWPPERGPIGRGRVTARLNGPPGALQ